VTDQSGSAASPASQSATTAQTANVFAALAHPVRLRLLEFLASGDWTVSQCATHLGLTQSRVAAHLAVLTDCGFIRVRRDGQDVRHGVGEPTAIELVRLAAEVAKDNGCALSWCLNIPGTAE
jgi:DNA-binding transcriptional ArsR family regulator